VALIWFIAVATCSVSSLLVDSVLGLLADRRQLVGGLRQAADALVDADQLAQAQGHLRMLPCSWPISSLRCTRQPGSGRLGNAFGHGRVCAAVR
jgi:hypothetical protein